MSAGGNLKNDDYHWKKDKARSTGVLGGFGSHVIDQARWIFGDVRRVGASVKTFKPIADPEMPSIETANDSAMVTFDFASGVQGMIYISRVRYPDSPDCFSVSGEKGRLCLTTSIMGGNVIKGGQLHEDELMSLEIPDHLYEGVDRSKSGLELFKECFKGQPFYGYAFVESILNNTVVPPSFYEGMKAQEVIDAAFRSDKTDTLVTL